MTLPEKIGVGLLIALAIGVLVVWVEIEKAFEE